ncbi:MAG: SPOR domain-containing protein, partial [Acetobacter sp.]
TTPAAGATAPAAPAPAPASAAPAPGPVAQGGAQADGAALKPVPSATLPAQGTAAPAAEAAAPEALKEAPVPTDDASDGEEEAAPVAKPAAKKAATVPRGTAGGKYQVQLAALQTEAEAQKEWARLKTRYPTLFGGVTPAFVRTEQNNATFYRLRVLGFGAVADAKDFCSSVRERGMACMVVRP